MLNIIVDHAPSQADNDLVREGIVSFNEKITGEERDKAFSVFLKNESGKMIGGIQAWYDKQSVYIDVLWVDEPFRGQGYGTKLLAAAEQEGQKLGCDFCRLETWSFQAEGFYLKNGYQRLGEIKEYWLGYSKIFLRKGLN